MARPPLVSASGSPAIQPARRVQTLIPRTEDGLTVFASLPLMAFALKSVRTYPGQTVKTLIPALSSSTRAALPNAFMANLVAL